MISLIHPSRGRAQKSFDNTMDWISKAGCDVEVILSIDSDDNWKEYFDRYPPYPSDAKPPYVRMYMGDHKNLVEATNHAAEKSSGDILVYLSDDFACFPNWGKVLEEEFAKYSGSTLLKVDDMLQPFHVKVLTIPIMNRACYEKLGYFFHPDFKSMHCDEHLYWRTQKLGVLKFAPHIKFEHKHVSVGKAENDATYDRSAKNWDHGVETFARHKRMGFVS